MADERLDSVRERGRANLFWRYLGIEVEAAGEGWVRLRVPMRDELRNAPGAPVHGGVLATLVDAAVGGALGTYGAAVVEIFENLQTLFNDRVAFIAFDVRNKTDTTGVVFICRRIKALRFGQADRWGGFGRNPRRFRRIKIQGVS